MPPTKSFRQLVQCRATTDAAFADALLREGINTMLVGDDETGKAILHDDKASPARRHPRPA